MPLRILWLLVPLAPALFSYGFDLAAKAAVGEAQRFLPGSHSLLLRALLVSLPFLVLAVVATYMRKAATPAWTAAVGRAARLALVLDLAFWTLYHAVDLADGGGRPGLPGLVLGVAALLSPVWIGLAMYRVVKRARQAA